jgi:hypothetical protein
VNAAERRVASRARIGTRGWWAERLAISAAIALIRLAISAAIALIAGGTAGVVLWVPSLLIGGIG